MGGLDLGPHPGGGAPPARRAGASGGEDPLLDPVQRLGVGLRLLPDDRLQLLHPPAHGDQGVQHLPVEVAPTTLGGPSPAKASSSKRRMTWSRGLPPPRS